jgi:hypothetical protein
MMRTKYILIVTVVCIGIILTGGSLGIIQTKPQMQSERALIQFVTPKDQYVAVPSEKFGDEERDMFLERVRGTLPSSKGIISETTPETEIVSPISDQLETPTLSLPSAVATTTTSTVKTATTS